MQEPKVILRAVEPEDVDFMYECESDSDASKWSDYRAPFSRHQLLEYALSYDADPFKAGQLRLIFEKNGSKAGILDFYDISEKDRKASIGITVHPNFRHKGIGQCIMKEGVKYACNRLGLNALISKISTQNSLALSLFEKAGFKSICILPAWHRIGEKFHDFHLMHLFI